MAVSIEQALSQRTETDAIDFKREIDTSHDGNMCELVKDIVAIGNYGGGAILVGVDRDGATVGIDESIMRRLDPAPIGDIVQERLFDDGLVFVARKDHPILTTGQPALSDLFAYPSVVATEGTPTRRAFDGLSARFGPPPSLVETGSMILMRELLRLSDHLGCISQLQIEAEIGLGALVQVPVDLADTRRPIGLTFRADWLPTQAQAEFLADLRDSAAA